MQKKTQLQVKVKVLKGKDTALHYYTHQLEHEGRQGRRKRRGGGTMTTVKKIEVMVLTSQIHRN